MPQLPPNRLQIVVIAVAITLCLAETPSQAKAQQAQRAAAARQFHENATLPIEGNLRKRFLTAEELLADGRWTEAINVLQEIAQSDHKGLVQVQQGTTGGFQTYLNVATRCNVLMSRVTAEGLKSYRQKVDPQAKRWFDSWQRTRDETDLLRIVRMAFLSGYGDDALLALGETAWDRGDFSAARLWWEQIVPIPDEAKPADYPTVLRYPDSEIDQPTLIARIVLCSILDREHARAEDELRQFSLKFPAAEGWIAGQQGSLVDILKRELEHSRQWSTASETADVETFGMSASRFKMLPETIDVGALRWSRPLTPNLLPHPVEGFPFQNPPFSYHPVVHEGVAFVNDSESIRAWNVWTGEPAWQSDQIDPATVYPTNEEQQSAIPDKMCVGVPEYTMTIAENRLYARMGSAVSCPSNLPQRDLESDLVCLDLTQQGKLLWNLPARKVLNDGSWRFEGTPVVRAGRAFVAMCRRRPQLELMIVCLDAMDGRLLWQRAIGGFKTSVDDSQNRVSHLLLTLGGGRVFLNTDAGAIVALDAFDGRFEWAVTYESRTDETPASLSDPGQRGLLPAMFYRGWLIVAPNDADHAFCIEADSGRVRWQFPYISRTGQDIPELLKRELHTAQRRENQWRQLLGVAPGGSAGRLIVSGKSLTSIDLDTGNRIWQTPRTAFGRGLLADDQIFLPGRTSIEICSQQTGQLLRTVALKTENSTQQGGNLAIANGMMLVAQPNRIAAYCEYSQLKERIERDLTKHQDDSSLLIQLADLEMTEGAADAAETALRRVLSVNKQDHPHYASARQRLAKLWRDAGKVAFEHSQFPAAREKWGEALSLTDDPQKRLELIFNLAQAEPEHPENAVTWLQSILDDDQLISLPLGQMTAGQEAARRISRLIAEHGLDAYAQVAVAASRELEHMRANPKSSELRRYLQKFPHAAEVTAARQLLAGCHRSEGEVPEAFAILDESRRNASSTRDFVDSTIQIIELLEQNHCFSAATQFWESLSNMEPSLEVRLHGVEQNLGDALQKWRDTAAEMAPQRPVNFERSWTASLAADDHVVFPENEAPSDDMLSVLICSRDKTQADTWTWRCLNWRDGHLRWQTKAAAPIQIARWTPVHLMIGSERGWQAREIYRGRAIWTTERSSSATEIRPSLAIQTTASEVTTAWPISVDPVAGIQVLDPNDGQIVSRIKAPGNMQQLLTFADSTSLGMDGPCLSDLAPSKQIELPFPENQTSSQMIAFFQTTKPVRTWMAATSNPRSPWTLQEVASDSAPWAQSPLGIAEQIVALTTENHLVAHPIRSPAPARNSRENDSGVQLSVADYLRHRVTSKDGSRRVALPLEELTLVPTTNGAKDAAKPNTASDASWNLQNFATGQALPFAWTQSGNLLVVTDGSIVASLNPSNGTPKWSLGISGFPLESPFEQMCRLGDSIFLTSEGWLRKIDITSGKIVFQRYVGDAAQKWITSQAWLRRATDTGRKTANQLESQGLLAIWDPSHSIPGNNWILIADMETGQIVQRIGTTNKPKKVFFDQFGSCVILSHSTLDKWNATSHGVEGTYVQRAD